MFAPVTGTVEKIRNDGRPGPAGNPNFVAIREQGTGLLVYLVHVTPTVEVSFMITAGQPIGVTDNSGRQTAPHLHLAVRNREGVPIDPFQAALLNRKDCKLKTELRFP